ncbi:integral membrane protein [Colletotrichum abscissum]|uniref:uncharacterized protein n=1 Tax=Colletotrichum abscissum TaxID=1671311 RepID=UPI0027D70379|nr:uncharacterized protein CABS01_17171 [Colletotrichum abscissum]KAK1487092.1 integral membrane protein [Colletotrichum abscissum]
MRCIGVAGDGLHGVLNHPVTFKPGCKARNIERRSLTVLRNSQRKTGGIRREIRPQTAHQRRDRLLLIDASAQEATERPPVAGCYLGQRRNTGDTVANVCVSISELLVDVSCAMSHRFWTLGVLVLQLAVAAVNAASAAEILSQVPSCASECISSTFITSACDPEDVTACICLDIAVQSELSTSTVEGALCEGYPKASRRTEVRRTLIISCSLVLFIVTLRLFTSKQYAGGLWRDDYMTILAAALLIALAAVYLHITSIGFGMHYWTIPVGNGVVIRKVR